MSKNKKNFNFGPNDNAVQEWKSFKHGQIEYSFDHLKAQKIEFQISDKVLTFYITFSHHCFCKTEADYNDKDELLYNYDKDPRHFHLKRYELSLKIGDVIKDLPGKKVFHGGYGSYLCIELVDEKGISIYYQIVFEVFRSAKKLRLHVTSAYQLQGKPPRGQKVKFDKIALAIFQGRKPPQPSKN